MDYQFHKQDSASLSKKTFRENLSLAWLSSSFGSVGKLETVKSESNLNILLDWIKSKKNSNPSSYGLICLPDNSSLNLLITVDNFFVNFLYKMPPSHHKMTTIFVWHCGKIFCNLIIEITVELLAIQISHLTRLCFKVVCNNIFIPPVQKIANF